MSAAAAGAMRVTRGGRARILVADDDPFLLALIECILDDKGYEVAAVPDGQEALARYVGDAKFDIVLLDVVMPKMNGIEAIHAIRLVEPGAKILLMSGSPRTDFTALLRESDIAGFVRKPFTIDVLVQAIEACLGREAAVMPHADLIEFGYSKPGGVAGSVLQIGPA